jgi:hypothetical protein
MTVIIFNPPIPDWVRLGEKRPPNWMRKYFPEAWEHEFIRYGEPEEVGKYYGEELMKRMRSKIIGAITK